MTDAEIVNLYWDRNTAAVDETKQKYEHYLTKTAYNILSDGQDCEECVNDTYLAAWNSMPEHRPGILSTYLGKITRQISIDVFRKKNSIKRYASEYAMSLEELGDTFTDGRSIENEYEAKQLVESIGHFLRSLPADARSLFIGRYYFFDSLKTAAAYCNMSEPKAKSMLYRTRQNLRDYLIKEGYDL